MLARDFESELLGCRIEATAIGPFAIGRLRSRDAIQLVEAAVQKRQNLDIAICNAHTLLSAMDDPRYAATLQKMTLLNDGIGISLASKLLREEPFPENLNGTDLIPRILANIGIPLRIYLLGAKEEQVRLAKEHIETAYPKHQVVGYRDGYFASDELDSLCQGINEAKPDLLLVAMGNPRQETFIVENRSALAVPVAIGVGALFDFMSGAVVRAPKIVQAAGLEWLFRLLQEPRRLFRRYVIGIPRFLFALMRIRFSRSGVSR
ncbi:WecB/TagA/CpsF family glycosyltransferase [Roseibium aggregatum]|uniref:WecB/TagA/CpsF family glycosyltransferase n=1 Tax=Roseibium aggregatum TaxID=187304 RepID=UPI001E474D4E|nr:WecB/TagA/CpsF family glycosyltransferase [Roseibium aggregatum]UES36784.1 WecB/TagA/CpsF family glycosyltransferase [Roseibium aggregatum]